jgi:hypothetical protein
MGQVFRNYAVWIGKGRLSASEGDAVLFLILPILPQAPLELGLWHKARLADIGVNSHTFIWLIANASKKLLTSNVQDSFRSLSSQSRLAALTKRFWKESCTFGWNLGYLG